MYHQAHSLSFEPALPPSLARFPWAGIPLGRRRRSRRNRCNFRQFGSRRERFRHSSRWFRNGLLVEQTPHRRGRRIWDNCDLLRLTAGKTGPESKTFLYYRARHSNVGGHWSWTCIRIHRLFRNRWVGTAGSFVLETPSAASASAPPPAPLTRICCRGFHWRCLSCGRAVFRFVRVCVALNRRELIHPFGRLRSMYFRFTHRGAKSLRAASTTTAPAPPLAASQIPSSSFLLKHRFGCD